MNLCLNIRVLFGGLTKARWAKLLHLVQLNIINLQIPWIWKHFQTQTSIWWDTSEVSYVDKNQRSAVGAHVNEGREQIFFLCVFGWKIIGRKKNNEISNSFSFEGWAEIFDVIFFLKLNYVGRPKKRHTLSKDFQYKITIQVRKMWKRSTYIPWRILFLPYLLWCRSSVLAANQE